MSYLPNDKSSQKQPDGAYQESYEESAYEDNSARFTAGVLKHSDLLNRFWGESPLVIILLFFDICLCIVAILLFIIVFNRWTLVIDVLYLIGLLIACLSIAFLFKELYSKEIGHENIIEQCSPFTNEQLSKEDAGLVSVESPEIQSHRAALSTSREELPEVKAIITKGELVMPELPPFQEQKYSAEPLTSPVTSSESGEASLVQPSSLEPHSFQEHTESSKASTLPVAPSELDASSHSEESVSGGILPQNIPSTEIVSVPGTALSEPATLSLTNLPTLDASSGEEMSSQLEGEVDQREQLDAPVIEEWDLLNFPHLKYFPDADDVTNILDTHWFLIGASRRGRGHSIDKKLREDDFSVWNVDQKLALVAIADGVGTCSHARHGARAAVQGATSVPEEQLRNLAELTRYAYNEGKCTAASKDILMEAMKRAAQYVSAQAERDNMSMGELHSTLLVFLAIPCQDDLFVASVQIGDGALYVCQGGPDAHRWQLLQPPQIQPDTSGIIPFMKTQEKEWLASFRAELLKEHPLCIMGITDGILDDIILEPPEEFVDTELFYEGMKTNILNKSQPVQVAQALAKYLGYHVDGSFDDRTLVCLYHI